MIPPTVLIQYDKCRLTLNLPIFFEVSPITNIRKVFKLLDGRPYQNETAHEILGQFFPAWERDTKDRLERAKAELTAAKRDAEEKRRHLAALGSTVDENIEQAKRWLAHAKKRAKKQPGEVDEYRAALNKAMRPKTDYQQAVKTVKRLEATVKQANAALERSGKVINAYNQNLR